MTFTLVTKVAPIYPLLSSSTPNVCKRKLLTILCFLWSTCKTTEGEVKGIWYGKKIVVEFRVRPCSHASKYGVFCFCSFYGAHENILCLGCSVTRNTIPKCELVINRANWFGDWSSGRWKISREPLEENWTTDHILNIIGGHHDHCSRLGFCQHIVPSLIVLLTRFSRLVPRFMTWFWCPSTCDLTVIFWQFAIWCVLAVVYCIVFHYCSW